MHECGLPGAVRPDRAHPRARRYLERDVAEDLLPAETHGHTRYLQRHRVLVPSEVHADRPPARRRASTKNGAPTNAVMTPIGISAGATAVRARRSTRMRNEAPKRTESGNTWRYEVPASSLIAWGTMIPTNPIKPATDTAAAVASDAATTTTTRSRPTFRPRLSASRSPTSITSRRRRTSQR